MGEGGHVWRSKDNLRELVLQLHYVSPGNQTQFVGHGCKLPYLLCHLADPPPGKKKVVLLPALGRLTYPWQVHTRASLPWHPSGVPLTLLLCCRLGQNDFLVSERKQLSWLPQVFDFLCLPDPSADTLPFISLMRFASVCLF